MTRYFMKFTPLFAAEVQMMTPPRHQPRRSGRIVIEDLAFSELVSDRAFRLSLAEADASAAAFATVPTMYAAKIAQDMTADTPVT